MASDDKKQPSRSPARSRPTTEQHPDVITGLLARRTPTELTRDELTTLHLEYRRTGDSRIRAELVEAYEGLARAMASRFDARRSSPEDLIQVALIGLLHAIDRFEPDRGVQFTTFAWRTIEGELKRHFRDRTWVVRAPRRVQEHYLEVARATDDLTQRLHRSPTIQEIAQHTNFSDEEVVEAIEARAAYRMVSLDAPLGDDDDLMIQIGDDDPAMAAFEHSDLVSHLLSKLPARERRIVELRFVERLTQSEIANRLGISQMHVSRLLARSLARMREVAESS